ncbi:PKD domain-containing protein [uncultured Desulfuromonas sp.]|uniref:PKD domain-containing protein n=1 Tax=uncultured Desulfuromonas sp. TaxID=181013 RepID=UPI00260CA5CC|nr:PKD domain-containing protein [uncultured Desulfuromonas sp.]
MGTTCGSCHVGGSLVEKGLDGLRHSQRPVPNPTTGPFNPYSNYVLEQYVPATGAADFEVATAAWSYPATMGGEAVIAPAGWGPGSQMMMPNVREADCFMCHLEGYNNIVNSAATQMGYFNAAPSMGAGLMNMFTQAYMPGTFTLGGTIPGFEAFGNIATLSGAVIANLKAEPPTANCMQCHLPNNMANFTEMFTTFLSAAPMQYNADSSQQPNGSAINGMAMPGYDLNSAFVAPNAKSPSIVLNFMTMGWEDTDGNDQSGPFGIFPMALDADWGMFDNEGNPNMAVAGGDKDGESGPLFYAGRMPEAGLPMGDQNALKKATIPFPKADWFKRGDLWGDKKLEVHLNLGCGGCHYNTNSTNPDLNQCDPGRGKTRMGGVESGQVAIDTHNTVKRCQDCHITGTNVEGIAIGNFSAPNPTAAHRAKGLLANVTKALRTTDGTNEVEFDGNHLDVIDCTVCHIYKPTMSVRSLDSTSGNRYPAMIGYDQSKGMMGMFTDPMTSDNMSDAQAIGAVTYNMGNQGFNKDLGGFTSIELMIAMTRLGVADFSSKIMVDPTWGPRLAGMMASYFPTLFDGDGMATYDENEMAAAMGLIGKMAANFPGMADGATDGDAARAMLKAEMKQWTPIYGWYDNHPKMVNGQPNPEWRRNLIPINFIVAQMWDDANGDFDANGDQAELNANWMAADPDHPGENFIKWDPWIARDMKAKWNFAGGPLATIPIGFGSDPAYDSVYAPDGQSFSGDFQFVGVYGGNVMLTTPEEIDAFKTHAGADWVDTQLVFFGGNPFQVTHNVVATETYVLGNDCADCHAPGKGFFSGGYDMTGSGVPATAEYDYDDSGFTFGMDLANPMTTTNMMQRPVVDFEVMAFKDDLRTGSEALRKSDGKLIDVHFDSCLEADKSTPIACEDGAAVYRLTHDLGRDQFMYPELDSSALATKIALLEDVDAMKAQAGLVDDGDGGFNAIVPVAAITGVTGATFDEDTTFGLNGAQLSHTFKHYTATIGAELTLNATDEGAGYSYYWQTSDVSYGNFGKDDYRTTSTQVEGASATYTFNKLGTFTVTLTAVSPDGTRVRSYAKVTVVNPASTIVITPADLTAFSSRSVTLTFNTSAFAGDADQLVIYWGDGKKDTVAIDGTDDITDVAHDYMLFAGFDNDEDGTYSYNLSVYAWDSATNAKVDMKATATVEITLP